MTASPQGDPPFAELLEEPFRTILAFQPSEAAADAGQPTVPQTARKPPGHTTASGATHTDRVKHLVDLKSIGTSFSNELLQSFGETCQKLCDQATKIILTLIGFTLAGLSERGGFQW